MTTSHKIAKAAAERQQVETGKRNPIVDAAIQAGLQGTEVEIVAGPMDQEDASIMPEKVLEDNYKGGKTALQFAETEARAFIKAQSKVTDAEQKLALAQDSQSRHIMEIAWKAQELEPNGFLLRVSVFRRLCAHAEQAIAKADGKTLSEQAPSWAKYKGRIVQAMLAGFEPRKYQTVSSLVKAHRDAVAAETQRNTAETGEVTRSPGTIYFGNQEIAASDKFKKVFSMILTSVVPMLTVDEQDQLAEQIATLAGKAASAANDRRAAEAKERSKKGTAIEHAQHAARQAAERSQAAA